MTLTPMRYRILVLPGDHVGPEVMAEALKVLDLVVASRNLDIDLDEDLCGGCSIDEYGAAVTDSVLRKAQSADAVLFGSVGGPEWGTCHPNPESGLLRLRQQMNAFANIRPCKFYAPDLIERSPLRPEAVDGINFIILRENCGGAYFGPKEETRDSASDTWKYTRVEVERSCKVAAALATELGKDGKGNGGPATVWSSDKANVLASGRLWRTVTSQVFRTQFPTVPLKHQLADSLSMMLVKSPTRFNGVIHTDNTFGDMLSDQAGGIVGTLGVLPSASLCDVPAPGKRCRGIYEPVHGSAPDIAGKGLVNPIAQILSMALMLRYSLDLPNEASLVELAVQKVLASKANGGLGIRTPDLGGRASTSEVGNAVCDVLGLLLEECTV